MKKILITGVAGLIGSRLASWIIKNTDYEVIGVDNLSGGYLENVPKEVVFYKKDLNSEPSEINDIFSKHRPDYVYHFAAYAAEGLSPFIRRFNYENNVVATATVINNCIKYDVSRLIFASSLAVYGHGDGGIFDEDQTPKPIDPYGVAKFACEMDIQIAGEQHGLDWCIIRPHNVYGIKQNIWDKYRNVLGIWMYQHLNGEKMTIFGDGLQKRAFSYVDDILEPLFKASSEPSASKEIINLGGIYDYTILEANEILRNVIGSGQVHFLEARHEVKNSIPTWEKSERILDFKQNYSLEDGLKEMWEWAKEQPMRSRFLWSEYELDKNIYKFWQ